VQPISPQSILWVAATSDAAILSRVLRRQAELIVLEPIIVNMDNYREPSRTFSNLLEPSRNFSNLREPS
jgi:hypothetical protein